MTDEINMSTLVARAQRIAERAATRQTPWADTVSCPDCLDTRWTETNLVATPCRYCNPVGYRRWADGHYTPGHHCEACDMAARAELKVGRDIDPTTGLIRPGVLSLTDTDF